MSLPVIKTTYPSPEVLARELEQVHDQLSKLIMQTLLVCVNMYTERLTCGELDEVDTATALRRREWVKRYIALRD